MLDVVFVDGGVDTEDGALAQLLRIDKHEATIPNDRQRDMQASTMAECEQHKPIHVKNIA